MGSSTVQTAITQSIRWMTRKLQKRVPYNPHNVYLEGPFAPEPCEHTITTLKVNGQIPAALNGLLLRIGPNPLQVQNPGAYHWFLGDGMVHGVRLQQGQALWYRSRFVGVDSVNQALNRPLVPGPRRGPFDVVNTNIIGHAGKLWALVEAGSYPVEMDRELNTQRHGLFNSTADRAFTAHPHEDHATGELHAICYDAMQRNKIRYLNIDKQGALKREVSIPVHHGPMIHDCAITQSYVVILDLPVTFSMRDAIKGSALPYSWNPQHRARVGLLPRQGSAADIRWFDVAPCFVFHTCNAYDLPNGDVIVDLVVHERMFSDSNKGPLENQQISFERWTLEHSSGQLRRQVISAEPQDFPRLDERLTGKPYRYAYTVGITRDAEQPTANCLYRYDLHTGAEQQHHYGENKMSGEVVFVPKHPTAAEDEGWLLSYVHDLNNGPSQVVILDAQNLNAAPLATIELPVRVPLGFHGNWVAD